MGNAAGQSPGVALPSSTQAAGLLEAGPGSPWFTAVTASCCCHGSPNIPPYGVPFLLLSNSPQRPVVSQQQQPLQRTLSCDCGDLRGMGAGGRGGERRRRAAEGQLSREKVALGLSRSCPQPQHRAWHAAAAVPC